MISINRPDIQLIAREYYTRLYNWLGISTKKDKLKKIFDDNTVEDRRYKLMLKFVWEKISLGEENLILCKPENFCNIVIKFNDKFNRDIILYNEAEKKAKKNTSFGLFKERMETLYCDFMQYKKGVHGYWLVKRLNIKSCPYCNRTYTFSLNDEHKARPEYDHFYPKSKYPYLALSFYNLIPSCPICNHLKGENEIDLNPYIIDSENSPMKFKLDKLQGIDNADDIELKIECRDRCGEQNVQVLGLEEFYNQHKDYVKEIIDKALAYNASYYDGLEESFRGIGLDSQEIDNLIWGVYLENQNLGKRPLSKLTLDILEQLGIK